MIHEPHAWPKNILFTHAKDSQKGPFDNNRRAKVRFFCFSTKKVERKKRLTHR